MPMTPLALIPTRRLAIVAAGAAEIEAALAGPDALGRALCATVPSSWPHEYLDQRAFEHFLRKVRSDRSAAGWWLRFVLLVEPHGSSTLIGSAGYKGPPNEAGELEIGYGIVACHRRRGYASEVVGALVSHAFELPGVQRVVGETLPELESSMAVMRRCGMRRVDRADGRELPLRFEIDRPN